MQGPWHTKTLKQHKTLNINKTKSLTNISWGGSNIQYLALIACSSYLSKSKSSPNRAKHSSKGFLMLDSLMVSSIISLIKHTWLTSSYSSSYLLMSKMFSSTIMFLKEIFFTLVLQFIKALVVAKNGHPRITSIWIPTFWAGFVSSKIKSKRNQASSRSSHTYQAIGMS